MVKTFVDVNLFTIRSTTLGNVTDTTLRVSVKYGKHPLRIRCLADTDFRQIKVSYRRWIINFFMHQQLKTLPFGILLHSSFYKIQLRVITRNFGFLKWVRTKLQY